MVKKKHTHTHTHTHAEIRTHMHTHTDTHTYTHTHTQTHARTHTRTHTRTRQGARPSPLQTGTTGSKRAWKRRAYKSRCRTCPTHTKQSRRFGFPLCVTCSKPTSSPSSLGTAAARKRQCDTLRWASQSSLLFTVPCCSC